MPDPIEVVITNESEMHCLKIVLQSRGPQPPLEIFLHTTQAIDLVHKLSRVICELRYRDSRELLRQKFGVLVEPMIERGDDPAAQELKAEGCPDCEALRRHAYSDATTAGFFYTECERHRKL